jgi:hypothetical protein
MITKETQVKINNLLVAMCEHASSQIIKDAKLPVTAVNAISKLIEVCGSNNQPPAALIGFIAPPRDDEL